MVASLASHYENPREVRLPVTIITGFLGSGKTTLLNHILAMQKGLRIAVLVNEIGEIGIDGELIVSAGDDILELSNGCICCSINNDLMDAVFKILHRECPVDYVIVETTGLADPLPVVLAFLRSEFREIIRVDSVIAIADAENFSLDLFDTTVAQHQLRFTDIVLLNKCDLVDVERLEDVEAKIRYINDHARIARTTRCQISLPLILSAGLFQSDCITANLMSTNPDRGVVMGTYRLTDSNPFPSRVASHLQPINFKISSNIFQIIFIEPKVFSRSMRMILLSFFTLSASVSLSIGPTHPEI